MEAGDLDWNAGENVCDPHANLDESDYENQRSWLAKLRLDGFVGLYTNPYTGRLVTQPLEIVGDRMLVNSIPDPRNDGWLRVEIRDEEDRVIDGFGRDECRPLTEEGLYNEVTWSSGRSLGELAGRRAKICIYQFENVFYAFRFVSGADV